MYSTKRAASIGLGICLSMLLQVAGAGQPSESSPGFFQKLERPIDVGVDVIYVPLVRCPKCYDERKAMMHLAQKAGIKAETWGYVLQSKRDPAEPDSTFALASVIATELGSPWPDKLWSYVEALHRGGGKYMLGRTGIQASFREMGVDDATLNRVMNAFAVQSKFSRVEQVMRTPGVSPPTFIVRGQYVTGEVSTIPHLLELTKPAPR